MEEVTAIVAAQAGKSRESQNIQSFDGTPKRTSFIKNLTRKKSILTFTTNFFSSNKVEKAHVPKVKFETQDKTRLPTNPFVSLRGFRDNGKRAVDLETTCCRNSLPPNSKEQGKPNDNHRLKYITNCVAVDELNKQKAMRRRSLQDLLETVGTRFSLSRRQVYRESSNSKIEAPSETTTEIQEISLLVLPEPALPIPEPPTAVLDSISLRSNNEYSEEAANFHGKLAMRPGGAEVPLSRPALRAKPDPYTLNVAIQPINTVGVIHPCQSERKSHELDRISFASCPEKACHITPADSLLGIGLKPPTHVRFSVPDDPPPYRCNNDSKEVTTLEAIKLDPSFLERSLSRGKRYESIYDRTGPEQTESLADIVEKDAALDVVKTSSNLERLSNESRFSVDSSETDTNDMSERDWIEDETEAQIIIDRGKEIMNLRTPSPSSHTNRVASLPSTESYLHFQGYSTSGEDGLSSAPPLLHPVAPHSEISTSGSLNKDSERLPIMDDFKPQMISNSTSPRMERVVSLKYEYRFQPMPEDFGSDSSEPTLSFYPLNEFCAPHAKDCASESSVIEDLYQNPSKFFSLCLLRRTTHTHYPRALSNMVPNTLSSTDKNRELLRLPLEAFQIGSLSAYTDGEYGYLGSIDNYNQKADAQSLNNTTDVFDLNTTSTRATKVGDPQAATFNEEKDAASRCCRNDSPYLDGFRVGDIDPAHRHDMGRMNRSRSPLGSLTSENPPSDTGEMDESYELAIDSAQARLYLGSLYSSTDSLQSVDDADITYPRSVDSILRNLKGAQPEKAKQVKTWIEMERDFLDKFAPGTQLLPGKRRTIAVHEAFKKLKGLGEWSSIERFDSGFQDSFDIEQERSSCSREAYMGSGFQFVKDSGNCRLMREHCLQVKNPYQNLEVPSQSLPFTDTLIIDSRGIGNELFELHQHAHALSIPPTAFRENFDDQDVNQQAASPELSPSEDMLKSHYLDADKVDASNEFGNTLLGIDGRFRSREYPVTGTTIIPMLSGNIIMQHVEHLKEHPADASYEENAHSKDESSPPSMSSKSSDSALNAAPSSSMFENATMSPSIKLLRSDIPVERDAGQLSIWEKNDNFGFVRTKTVHHCSPPIRLNLESSAQNPSNRSKVGRPIPIEAVRIASLVRPYPAIGKLVLTPTTHNFGARADSLTQTSQKFRCISPSPSVADTEMSENFGEKLIRSECFEKGKENNL